MGIPKGGFAPHLPDAVVSQVDEEGDMSLPVGIFEIGCASGPRGVPPGVEEAEVPGLEVEGGVSAGVEDVDCLQGALVDGLDERAR